MNGNKRFSKDQMLYPRHDSIRREAVASKQTPFAIIFTCSDSRVPPEIIFDQGVGDLFVVRVAGNVCGPIELDSIEYAALYLHASVILVMGHENCGAVKAVLQGDTKDIENVATHIEPSVEKTRNMPGNHLENAIKANVLHCIKTLNKSAVLKRLIEEHKLEVFGGYYNLNTGVVSIID